MLSIRAYVDRTPAGSTSASTPEPSLVGAPAGEKITAPSAGAPTGQTGPLVANGLPLRLHLACGEVYLRGYVNIDPVGDLAAEHPQLAEANATVLENYFKRPYRKRLLGHDKRGRNVVDMRAEVHDLSMFDGEDPMTKNKDFKTAVRQHMAATGQSYTAARADLEAKPAASSAAGRIPTDARIFVTGHGGLVGGALLRKLQALGYSNLLVATRDQLDLRDQAAVNYWFRANRPEYVFLVAGTVGGIGANSLRPADFLYDNMMIHATVVHASHSFGVAKLLYLGSSCIYPREANQPITEDQLLTGPLEPTNEGYALAKIAGIKLCEFYRRQYGDNFIAAMPTNLYGPGDNFHPTDGHLVPMLMRRFHEAKLAGAGEVTVWGTGQPRRELMHVDDLADACLFLMANFNEPGFINVGTGVDETVAKLAGVLRDLVHSGAELTFDTSKPDGMRRKVLDVSRIHRLGWHHHIDLADGLASTYDWFTHTDDIRAAPSGAGTKPTA